MRGRRPWLFRHHKREMTSRYTALLCLRRLTLLPAAARAAASADPDWPCIQRLVPRIAAAQVWGGPEPKPADWQGDLEVNRLASRLAVRATPIAETEALVEAFAEAQPNTEHGRASCRGRECQYV